MKKLKKKLVSLNDILSKLTHKEKERVKDIRKYYDDLYLSDQKNEKSIVSQEELNKQEIIK